MKVSEAGAFLTQTDEGRTMAKETELGCHRFVDMWALPGMHLSNVELLQKLTTADTQHFTTHMDTVGKVSEQDLGTGDWEETHLVGLRTDVWKADEAEMASALKALKRQRRKELKQGIKRSGRLNAKQTAKLEAEIEEDDVMNLQSNEIEKRRLVLKLFKTNTQRTRWCGTLEETTVNEIHNSIGSKRSLLSFAAVLPRREFVTQIQQNHRTFRVPSLFTMGYVEDQQIWHLTLRRHWVSLGSDFTVEADGQPIGKVDGKLLSFGSDSYVRLQPHELAGNTQFVDMLTLFAASVGYHSAMRRSVARRVQAVHAGASFRHLVENDELRLRHNGRAAA